MLRRLRIGISALLFVLISFFFLDFAEILPNSFHRLAHLQFIPAVLSLSIGILLFLIVLTLLFGRVYCSTICPMGILQDVIARISKATGKKKEISTNKSADIPIRSFLNIVILHLNSLDIQLVNVHSSYFQCFSFSEVSHSI